MPPQSPTPTADPAACAAAQAALDAHLRAVLAHHFSPDTGTPFWLDWAREQADFDPVADVRTVADLARFPHFQDDWLRDLPNTVWVPRARAGQPFYIFETGGTTGMPKQRVSWEDHLRDYEAFSATLDDAAFPPGANWLMVGPTGPRRLRLCIEHLAHLRGGSCYFVDLDPRWVKKLIAARQYDQAEAYKRHVVDQAVTILKNRPIACLFTTPKILEAMGERVSLVRHGIRGCFCGGTTMTPQLVRFICEEVLEGQARFQPTYGNTLMGLACSTPVGAHNGWSVTYHAPQPRALLRCVDPDDTARSVDYGAYGRVELTTLTYEFFMPRFLERDEAIRRPPHPDYPWDGVGDVRPYAPAGGPTVVEGVY